MEFEAYSGNEVVSVAHFWKATLTGSQPLHVPQAGLAHVLWYDGVVLALMANVPDVWVIAFVHESEDRRRRLFAVYSLPAAAANPGEIAFIRAQLAPGLAEAHYDADQHEAAAAGLIDRCRDADDVLLIDADPALTMVFRSTLVPKGALENCMCRMEDFYALPSEARAARQKYLDQLFEYA